MDELRRGLAPEAYEEVPGDEYPPYVPVESSIPEMTFKAVLLGAVLGALFGMANAYIGLRVGLTVSASIPVAVMSIAVFTVLRKFFSVQSTILENNISQTVGSAGESLAAGVIFTLPALFMWGIEPRLMKLIAITAIGGVLGVLFMIPLRRYLIKGEHGKLPYPEGTACAEVLVAGDVGGAHAHSVFLGLGVGAAYKWLMSGLRAWGTEVGVRVPGIPKAHVSLETSPALLGVGYILGYRIAAIMVGGSLISWLVLIPMIAHFGEGFTIPLFPETDLPIREMSADELWNRYIRYVGAGAVAFGGIITLIRAIPTVVESFSLAVREIAGGLSRQLEQRIRTDSDIRLSHVVLAALAIVLILALVPHILGEVESLAIRLMAAVLIVIFAFFFVTVSSRIVGLIGSTSNPISGMTIATLLGTSFVFFLAGWTDMVGMVSALSVGAVVCMAAAVAGDTSQDLKTGFLVGATPHKQQLGELVGVVAATAFICISLVVLHTSYGFGSEELPAPQATLMRLVVEGVLAQNIPWGLVFIGMAIAAIMELFAIPSLPLAVGIYLPISTMTPIFVGGLVRRFIERQSAGDKEVLRERKEQGVLFGSGLVGGEGLMGVLIAFYVFFRVQRDPDFNLSEMGIGPEWLGPALEPVTAILFLGLIYLLYRTTKVRRDRQGTGVGPAVS